MSAWFTVYSPQSLQHLTPTDVTTYLGGPKVDWYILAEMFGIEDEAVVDQAVSALRVAPATGKLGEWFAIHYRPKKGRPLEVYRWADSKRVHAELAETEQNHLAGCRGRGVVAIRRALSEVVEVVAVELGLVHLEDMGLIIAGQVAEYFADVSGGIICDTNDEWWTVRRGVPKQLLGRP
jgi:hypothetical protein